jgi:excisionase family DNA binding protein
VTGQAPAPAEELLTPAEVADLFHVRTHTVTRWAADGRIPPEAIVRTLGGHRRYRAARIRALLEEAADTH